MNFEIADRADGVSLIKVSGRMDVQGALASDKEFNTIAEEKMNVIVDFSQVDFLASLGIRTLIVTCKALAAKGGELVLLNPQANVEKVLKSSGVDTVIPIAHSLDDALAVLKK